MLVNFVKKQLYSMGIQRYLSLRRLRKIDRLFDGCLLESHHVQKRILDLGCSRGKDLVQFLEDREDLEITGLDLKDYGLRQNNFRMVIGDAADIPFPDSHFDITLSIGVLEHIQPIEKLARVVREIDRVSKSYMVIIPSINTFFEPHSARLLWQLRDRNTKPIYPGILTYMSDEAWLALSGFQQARSCRYGHIPLFINNLLIYKPPA